MPPVDSKAKDEMASASSGPSSQPASNKRSSPTDAAEQPSPRRTQGVKTRRQMGLASTPEQLAEAKKKREEEEANYLRQMYGPPPLLQEESNEDYDVIYNIFRIEFDPQNLIEVHLVRELATIEFDLRRFRKLETTFYAQSGMRIAGYTSIETSAAGDDAKRLDIEAFSEGEVLPELVPITSIDLIGQRIEPFLPSLMKLHELIAKTEGLRSRVIRDLDRRQSEKRRNRLLDLKIESE